MGNIFSASEVLEIGIQIEKNGKDFYQTLASQTKNKKNQELFEYLANQEEKHMNTFQQILLSLEKYEPVEAYPGEYFAYINALAEETVFTKKDKGKELASKVKDEKEAIAIGIQAEKDSIIFYQGMKRVTPEYDQKIVEEVIKEEEKHLRQLLEIKTNL